MMVYRTSLWRLPPAHLFIYTFFQFAPLSLWYRVYWPVIWDAAYAWFGLGLGIIRALSGYLWLPLLLRRGRINLPGLYLLIPVLLMDLPLFIVGLVGGLRLESVEMGSLAYWYGVGAVLPQALLFLSLHLGLKRRFGGRRKTPEALKPPSQSPSPPKHSREHPTGNTDSPP